MNASRKSRVRPGAAVLLAAGILALAGCLDQNAPVSQRRLQTIKAQRKKVANEPRRIIFNNDGTDHPRGPETAKAFLARRTAPLMDSQVDAVSYNTRFGYRAETFPLVDDNGNELDKDHLAVLIEYCHRNGREAFWSMRMNDTHDSNIEKGLFLDQWKIDHRELLMAQSYTSFPYGWVNRPSWPWTAMDYEFPQVREHVLTVVTDVCRRYDVDAVELDFWRWPVFFKPQLYGQSVTQRHCDMMTDLLTRIRQAADEIGARRGRPILIAARVPDSIGYAREVGLDIERWLADDLVDILIGGEFFQLQPWRRMVEAARPYNVPVYACLSRSRIPDDLLTFRAEAVWAWQDGVSGIYLFNETDASAALLNELGDPKLLAPLPRAQKLKLGFLEWRHVQTVGSILKGGERFFDKSLLNRYEKPVPEVGGMNVGLEPGDDIELVYTGDRYMLTYNEKRGTYRLFDLLDDPGRKTDLAVTKPDVFKAMKDALDAWRGRNENILYNE